MKQRKKTHFPEWLRKRIPEGSSVVTRNVLRSLSLNTVCASAKCPNQGECFSRKRATFMLMGNVCTRNCLFCGVTHDTPKPLDAGEPQHIAEAVEKLALRHCVLTSVTRDDLEDGGAEHFRACIRAVKERMPLNTVEVLTPDFEGNMHCVDTVCDAQPDIYNHNIETVRSVFNTVRPAGDYDRSLQVLRYVKKTFPCILVKSGFMVGLGETMPDIRNVLQDLADTGCDIVTIGQYLKPQASCVDVDRFVCPEEFEEYENIAKDRGIRYVFAGPFIRSSYMAEDVMHAVRGTSSE